MRWTDPSGQCAAWGNTECTLVRTWDDVAALFPYASRTALPAVAQAAASNGHAPGPREVAEWAAWYSVIRAQPGRYALDRRPVQSAQIFSEYFLGRNILRELDSDLAALQAERDELQQLGSPTAAQTARLCVVLALIADFGTDQPLLGPDRGGGGGSVQWVDENATMRPNARDYQSGAYGARSNRLTRTPQAPEIKYIDAQGRERAVRFDGLEGNVLIDRKRAVATTPKVRETIRRQSEALRQNGLSGRWEVPTAFDARRAQKLFDELGIKNITVKVVPE